MPPIPEPTDRELSILKVLWQRGEATVREVHEALRAELPIVQNTVQAFLRTMEAKGLVRHRSVGRSFVYKPVQQVQRTRKSLVSGMLDSVFDGAIDQLVESAFAARPPSREELQRLKQLLAQAERDARTRGAP